MTDLLDLIAETLNVDAAELRADSSQENIAAWTSLKHLELMLTLEREYMPDAGRILAAIEKTLNF